MRWGLRMGVIWLEKVGYTDIFSGSELGEGYLLWWVGVDSVYVAG